MNESADESDFECFRRPKMTLQQLSTQMILSLGARYDLILSSSVIVRQPLRFHNLNFPCHELPEQTNLVAPA